MSDQHALRLSGDCSLRAIGMLHNQVVGALAASNDVEIDCTDAERIDLSFVQLMVSAASTARGQSKGFAVTNLSKSGQAAFLRAGVRLPLPAA